ncbi:MAG: 3-deoxy-manno-octulosonate cytidylyltransferase [Hydrogenobaculum sp.]|nr:MAG: 3-deoxy-manno-octulosonate cytidylyltransferase [Hydrogenobaculum sp.]PMP89989.1 MAG: 3-deoxy-manno-octulosonate cytidylyltransferase [Hydrogenobaculum sp.]
MKTLIVVPARLKSTRLKHKPLIEVCGKPIVRWVVENLKKTGFDILLTSDSEEVYSVVKDLHIDFVKTKEDLASGSDRVYEASKDFNVDFIINHQGDEIFSYKEDIENLVKSLQNSYVASLYTKLEKDSPANVKLVLDKDSNALYFSRSLIPYKRNDISSIYPLKHIGIYAFRKNILETFVKLPQSTLEQIEGLEQLRLLENSIPIKMVYTKNFYHGIDVEEDINIVKEMLCKTT